MIIKHIIDQLIQKKSITCIKVEQVMQSALNGGATPAQISAFFTGILMKGITYTEFEGMLKGIKHKEVHDYKQNIDFMFILLHKVILYFQSVFYSLN